MIHNNSITNDALLQTYVSFKAKNVPTIHIGYVKQILS